MAKKTVADRFWEKVSKAPHPKGCWEWIGSRDGCGYGRINVGGVSQKASRVAYRIAKGEIGSGLLCLHTCDNPRCVNPSHLYLGTAGDNAKDRVTRGRMPSTVGEANGRALLTETDVLSIRRDYAAGSCTYQSLGIKYGVKFRTIADIVIKRTWRRV